MGVLNVNKPMSLREVSNEFFRNRVILGGTAFAGSIFG